MRASDDQRPWYYRCPFTNWLMAAPWHWNMWTMYRHFRVEHRDPRRVPPGCICPAAGCTAHLYEPAHGRLRSAWLALTFPHVHHESEDE